MQTVQLFPFLFGGAFIEADSLGTLGIFGRHFPSFSEGLSLRLESPVSTQAGWSDFPSFSEGLSLRRVHPMPLTAETVDFPSFSEGLSLRL